MKLGMTLPVMEPDLDRNVLRQWVEAVDRGPWDSLAFGERIIFDNPDAAVLLGACAAWTERVDLFPTVFVAQLHNPVMLAKQIASADMLCDGRLRVGLGVGGREEDYQAAGADFATRRQADLANRVAAMRRVWAGEYPVDGVDRRVGPPPVQPGGPQLLAGAIGPRSVAAAAQWADGLCGMSFGPDPDEIGGTFALARQAWEEAGRGKPHLGTSFWFALEDGGRAQLERHLKRYFTWVGPAERDAIAASAGFAGSVARIKDLLSRIEDAGADECVFISTSCDVDQVHRIADAIG